MFRATPKEKQLAIDILSRSFKDNEGVNFIVKQDAKKEVRLVNLMSFAFEMCLLFGDVFLSEDKKACALILYPHKKN